MGSTLGCVHIFPVWFQDPGRSTPSATTCLASGRPPTGWHHPGRPRIPAWFDDWPRLHGLSVSLAGRVVGGSGLAGPHFGRPVLKQEAMGFGDVTLRARHRELPGMATGVDDLLHRTLFGVVFALANWFLPGNGTAVRTFLAIGTLFFLYAFKHLWPNSRGPLAGGHSSW
ncbi:MAG: hypothetical protein Ct9H300mP1_18070 [Planctomycetaceae bacterium]|nr:MAG: hypothetical protein Ct9H300mP1_18070 [Planctomycetaceae bacterium]